MVRGDPSPANERRRKHRYCARKFVARVRYTRQQRAIAVQILQNCLRIVIAKYRYAKAVKARATMQRMRALSATSQAEGAPRDVSLDAGFIQLWYARLQKKWVRRAVATNSALLSKLEAQLRKITDWDTAYAPVSFECAMAGLRPVRSPRTPSFSKVVAPEGALTPASLEAVVQSAVAPLLQRLQLQSQDLEDLRPER